MCIIFLLKLTDVGSITDISVLLCCRCWQIAMQRILSKELLTNIYAVCAIYGDVEEVFTLSVFLYIHLEAGRHS